MGVKRIVPVIPANRVDDVQSFYGDVLGMREEMNLGWIATYAADTTSPPQVSVATQGGAGAPVPDLSVEVDDFDAVHQRAIAAGFRIEYGPAVEDWGVRRFFVRDPFGRLVNVMTHVD